LPVVDFRESKVPIQSKSLIPNILILLLILLIELLLELLGSKDCRVKFKLWILVFYKLPNKKFKYL